MPTSTDSIYQGTDTEDAAGIELPDTIQFMRLLWALVHGLEKTSKRMSEELGVTGPQRVVLRIIGLSPGLSAGQLSALLHVHPSTLTGVLQRLVTQRLLTRVDDPNDRRRVLLRLTRQGRQVNETTDGTAESIIGEALKSVSAADRAATRRVLEQLARRLEASDQTIIVKRSRRMHNR